MTKRSVSRRRFLQGSAGALVAGIAHPCFASVGASGGGTSGAGNQDRPLVGCIGLGDRWQIVGTEAMKFGEVVAVCDVDQNRLEAGREKVSRAQDRVPDGYEDYRRLLDRPEIDAVVIVTPDHWHTKMSIDAMKAGKDVYCEKPLTLTIDEGKQICKVVEETKRVFQVGTTQRSEIRSDFIQAVALVRDGRIGKVNKISCVIGNPRLSDKLHTLPVPQGLNWDLWLGQAPMTDFLGGGKSDNQYPPGRSHFHFRWWYEYSGGKLTDWGAHHVDIAHWALAADATGPLSVEGTAEFPVPLVDGMPTESDRYNTAHKFAVNCKFANDVTVEILAEGQNGITFYGDKGKFVVRRGALKGKPVEELVDRPLPPGLIRELYKGKTPGNHMGNFFECMADRTQPVSDVWSHHRAVSTCHLANIAIRLGRKIEWEPVKQEIVGDPQANSFLSRAQRKGFEIVA
jgi:predicted dehydrogenase